MLGPAYGLWDWRLAQAWRLERADVDEDVGYLLLCFSAALPQVAGHPCSEALRSITSNL